MAWLFNQCAWLVSSWRTPNYSAFTVVITVIITVTDLANLSFTTRSRCKSQPDDLFDTSTHKVYDRRGWNAFCQNACVTQFRFTIHQIVLIDNPYSHRILPIMPNYFFYRYTDLHTRIQSGLSIRSNFSPLPLPPPIFSLCVQTDSCWRRARYPARIDKIALISEKSRDRESISIYKSRDLGYRVSSSVSRRQNRANVKL